MVTEANLLQVIIIIVFSYLVGSLPTAYIIARTRNINIFEQGSGNMGGTNVARTMGIRWGVVTIVLDVLKGVGAVVLSQAIMPDYAWTATTVSSIVVIIGHNWSLFATLLYTAANKGHLTVRGGKGGATAFGTLLMIAPVQVILGMFAFGFVLFLRTRYVSLGVISSFMLAVPWLVILIAQDLLPSVYLVYAIAIAVLILWRFRENIERIVKGTERRLGEPA
ncbi:MAG: glycerol-3-phosphate acyltransferase [Anaerolineae bacterium]|nr:glycerol-3-phosphate acyltransferase [Anaerolineae bacterium]